MRESCSCGAAIHVIGYRKALLWRATHLHNDDVAVIEQTTETRIPVGFTRAKEED
jgi:hypothetical protein